ncbi:hypothetical protein [Actinomadura sp. 9N407]|uniref:hypothetical protein n=1 Tax=Actinomadura sp. 9N407 TaxID=3375154 RepID=UPI0037A61276
MRRLVITLAALAAGLLLPAGVAQAAVHSANGLAPQTVTTQTGDGWDDDDECDGWFDEFFGNCDDDWDEGGPDIEVLNELL